MTERQRDLQFMRKSASRLYRLSLRLIVAAFLLFFVTPLLIIRWQDRTIPQVMKERFAPLLAQLENYKEAHGHYPYALDEVTSDPPRCPLFPILPYQLRPNGTYCLSCEAIGSVKYVYCSDFNGIRISY